MNFPTRILLYTLAGCAAGLLTIFLTDITGLLRIRDTFSLTATDLKVYQLVGMAFGAFLGLLLGVAGNLASGTRDWLRVVGFGLVVGMVAGVVGLNFGMAAFGPLYTVHAKTPLAFLGNVIARAIGWAFIGALAGTVDGWRKLSLRVGRNGFIGGLLGGLIGGSAFEIVPYLMPGVPAGAVSRTLGFTITGALIGLFIALVQEWLKEAWIKVMVGRNEGKEVLIERAETKIGRAELSDIPLFGNPQIARTHAVLVALPAGGYAIRDTGDSEQGVLVNQSRITGEQRLRSGDQIQIVDRVLVFFEKNVKERSAPVNRDTKRPSPNAVAQPGVSPYAIPTPAAPKASPSVVVVAGPHAGQRVPLAAGLTIGRDPAAGVPLPGDTKASRNHARLVADGSSWAIEDLQSTNGTFVNGQRITRVALAPGDTIVVGSSTLTLQ